MTDITPLEALKSFRKRKIMVVGDIMLDQYTFGDVSRISPEAPIPVVRKKSEKYVLGGAANVANNIASLGGKVFLVGIVGHDPNGQKVKDLLTIAGINAHGVLVTKRVTSVKNRILTEANQQIVRFDEENNEAISKQMESKLFSYVKKIVSKVDIIILSDYDKGTLTFALAQKIIKLAKSKKKFIIADIKPKNKLSFKGVTIVTPNLKEAKELTGEDEIKKIGKKLTLLFHSSALVTLGANGIAVFQKNNTFMHIPVKKVRVYDVSGAGDTVIATLALCISSGLNLENAAFIAAQAGELVVQKLGTATVEFEELISFFGPSVRHADDILEHPKLWGYEKWLENNDKYCCKLLVINKGYQCSLHYHNEKDEMFYVSKGNVRLESDGKISYMKEGSFTRIFPGTKHRFRGMEDSVIIEVSTHHEESDSHRIEESKKVE